MRKLFYAALIVWLFCVTMTEVYQTNALRMQNLIISQQENDIRELQQKLEPKTHANYYGPNNGIEPEIIQEY